MKIVFFGTSEFAGSILEHLVQKGHCNVVAVVSKPDAHRGRGLALQPTPVKRVSQTLLPSTPVFQPEKASAPEFVEQLNAFFPDVFLIVAYGELIKQELLKVPRLGCYNIHASLLPAYRGAAPIQRALIDGCAKTGISIFRLTKGMDSGDVLWQKSCLVDCNMNCGELTDQLLILAKEGAIEALEALKSGEAVFTPQHHEEATLAPKIAPEDLLLDQTQDVLVLHDRIRAFSPNPGAFFWVNCRERKLRLKVLKSHVDLSMVCPYRRWIVIDDGSLAYTSPDGTLILDSVQLEGKTSMSSSEFLRGIPLREILFI